MVTRVMSAVHWTKANAMLTIMLMSAVQGANHLKQEFQVITCSYFTFACVYSSDAVIRINTLSM